MGNILRFPNGQCCSEPPTGTATGGDVDTLFELTPGETPPLSTGFKFELHTLPVDPRAVGDGDGVTVYVSTSDARESTRVPPEIQMAVIERREARAQRNYSEADVLHEKIKYAGYRVLHINNEEILAKKYRIRLRGIDAPENAMPYGKEAKDELVKIIGGRCLRILIFYEDQYERFVGDMYCNGIFVQESMLKKGLAWHYKAYDRRPELAQWEKSARAKRIGLWASSNPEMPWKWRKNQKDRLLKLDWKTGRKVDELVLVIQKEIRLRLLGMKFSAKCYSAAICDIWMIPQNATRQNATWHTNYTGLPVSRKCANNSGYYTFLISELTVNFLYLISLTLQANWGISFLIESLMEIQDLGNFRTICIEINSWMEWKDLNLRSRHVYKFKMRRIIALNGMENEICDKKPHDQYFNVISFLAYLVNRNWWCTWNNLKNMDEWWANGDFYALRMLRLKR
ncbi:hypothetical protein L1887_23459 [Cichorium endivia]|nr:hypothetical protein L1887_23459 [Cichorium endivia]